MPAVAGQLATGPRVSCVEWLNPLRCPAHRVPEMVEMVEMVEMAGGDDRFGHRGHRSVRCMWEDVVAWALEVLVMMPCGFGVRRNLTELPVLAARAGWATLPAVRRHVWMGKSSRFSHYRYRAIEGVEMLAHLLYPERFPNRWRDDQLPWLSRSEAGLV